jgi:hypothetical protein
LPFDPKRKGDIKIVVGASIAVLLLGFFIAGAALVTTRGSKGIECSHQLNIGLATDIRDTLAAGPYFQTGGGTCGFWLALDNGDIAAYKAVQPSGCTLKWLLDHWGCGDLTLPASSLAQYPLSIQTINGIDVAIVNLGAPIPSTTTG